MKYSDDLFRFRMHSYHWVTTHILILEFSYVCPENNSDFSLIIFDNE